MAEDREQSRDERLRELVDRLTTSCEQEHEPTNFPQPAFRPHRPCHKHALTLLRAFEDAVRADRDMDWWQELAGVDAVAPNPDAVRRFVLSLTGEQELARIATEGRAMAAEAGKREALEKLERALRECLIESPHSYRGADAPKCLCRWCKARTLVGIVPKEPAEDRRPKITIDLDSYHVTPPDTCPHVPPCAKGTEPAAQEMADLLAAQRRVEELETALREALDDIDREWGECGCVGATPGEPGPRACTNCCIRFALVQGAEPRLPIPEPDEPLPSHARKMSQGTEPKPACDGLAEPNPPVVVEIDPADIARVYEPGACGHPAECPACRQESDGLREAGVTDEGILSVPADGACGHYPEIGHGTEPNPTHCPHGRYVESYCEVCHVNKV